MLLGILSSFSLLHYSVHSVQSQNNFSHMKLLLPPSPGTVRLFLSASLRPIFPKHTQLQNKTLMIHVPHSTVSFATKPPSTSFAIYVALLEAVWVDDAGDGIISGFRLSRTVVPKTPTAAERRNPGLVRSIRYQRTGLTRASVSEAWKVDVHANLRCRQVSQVILSYWARRSCPRMEM